MPGVNLKRLREGYEENKRGGDLYTLTEGVTLVYIHGLCRPDDNYSLTRGINHIELYLHYGLRSGNDKKISVCLDPELNPIINHPVVRSYLEKREINIDGGCPVCEALLNKTIDPSIADELKGIKRFLWGLTPIRYKSSKSSEHWQDLSIDPRVILTGKVLYEGFMGAFFDNGDISDLDSAIYIQIERTGKGRFDTDYEINIYTQRGFDGSVVQPIAFSGRVRKMITNAVRPDGDCDLFRVVSNLIRSHDDVENLISENIVQVVDSDGFTEVISGSNLS